eukprot:1431718-Rhodomonas_salina.4
MELQAPPALPPELPPALASAHLTGPRSLPPPDHPLPHLPVTTLLSPAPALQPLAGADVGSGRVRGRSRGRGRRRQQP